MKIYFVASIRGKSKYLENYKKIIKILKDLGIDVFCQDVLETTEEVVSTLSDERKIKHYKDVLKWINVADLVVAEVSYPSINVGHEVSVALEKGKPVIVLYTQDNEPHLLQGLISDKILTIKYSLRELKETLEDALESAKDQMDVRFNFFVPPRIIAYLDWIAKNKKLPRAVFLRRLIEEHMKRNKEYKS